MGAVFEVCLHAAEGLAGDVVDEKLTDDWLGDRSERTIPELQFVHDLNQDTGWSFFESPDDIHPFRPGFEMMKAHLDVLPVDHLLGGPGNGDAGADRGHDDEISVVRALQVTDVTIVRKDLRPQLQIGGGFEDGHLRRMHDDGIARVH